MPYDLLICLSQDDRKQEMVGAGGYGERYRDVVVMVEQKRSSVFNRIKRIFARFLSACELGEGIGWISSLQP